MPLAAGSARVRFEHRLFTKFSDAMFRRTETDGVPALAFSLDDRGSTIEATIRIDALMHELPAGHTDRAMLAKVMEALEFVAALRIGDPLPAEVLTGDASWEPDREHFGVARSRVRIQLVSWADGSEIVETDTERLLQIGEDPTMLTRFAEAVAKAAVAIGVTEEDIRERAEILVAEIAFVEALREWLLGGQRMIAAKISAMASRYRGDRAHMETLTQVHRLAETAVARTRERLELIDAQTGEILNALRNLDATRGYLRTNRDHLYRVWRAWRSYVEDWKEASGALSEGAWLRMRGTYRFLAPRYMAVKEWILFTKREFDAAERTAGQNSQMSWL